MAGEIQTNVNVSIVAAPQADIGTPAIPAAASRRMRRVSSNLTVSKDAYTSAEVRDDQQIADMRHGTKRAAGSIEGELSVGTYDPEIEASMRGTWVAGVTASEADFTTMAAAGSTLVMTGGDAVAKGFKVGDVIRLTGATVPLGNRNINFRVTGFSGGNRIIAVSPQPVIMSAVSVFGVAVKGRKVLTGKVRRAFTLEQVYDDVDLSEIFYGMRVGGAAFRLPPTGMATVSFDYQGTGGEILESANSPYFIGPADQTTTGVLAAVNGALRINGEDLAIVTGLDLNIALGLSSTPVVGSNTVPDIFYSRTIITGTVSAYFANSGLSRAFLDEKEFDIVALFEAAGTPPYDFIAFNLQRVKFSGNSKTIGADGGVIASFPFQGLVRPATSGYDATTMAIQRSNA